MNRPSRIVNRSLAPIADSAFTKVKVNYTGFIQNAINSVYDLYNYRGNNINDPLGVTGAVQPLGHDQWSAFYSEYYVAASKIEAWFTPRNTTTSSGIVFILPTRDTYTTTTAESNDAELQPYAKRKVTGTLGSPVVYIKHYMTTAKMFGRKDTIDDPNYSAAVNADPTTQWNWMVAGKSIAEIDVAGQELNVGFYIEITYYVQYRKRIGLAAS